MPPSLFDQYTGVISHFGMTPLTRRVAPCREICLSAAFTGQECPTVQAHVSLPFPLHLLLWLQVPNSPCVIICISLSGEKQTVCMGYKTNFCVQKHKV